MPVKQRYSADFKRTYSTGAMGGFDGYDFTMTFFRDNVHHAEDPSKSPHVDREIISEVILPAAALKEITRWLLQNVNDIEEKNGIIQEPLLKAGTERRGEPKGETKVLAAYS